MAGFPLTGIDPADPIPGIIREIKFAQGQSSTPGKTRSVGLTGNKTAAGSEPNNTLGLYIESDSDCVARFGVKSEIYLGYKKYVQIDQNATICAIAVPDGTGTSTRTITFAAGPATTPSSFYLMCIGERVEVPVATGDTATVIRDAAVALINAQLMWPVTAAAGIPVGELIVSATMAGTRHEWEITSVRSYVRKPCGVTVAMGAVVGAATDDDHTLAIAALANEEIYYQGSAKTQPASPTGAVVPPSDVDNGIGEHIAMINTQAMPANGKGQQVFFALLSNQGNATAVATASGANAVRAKFFHAENNDWTPMMLCAHAMAAHRLKEIAHPGSNMTDYGLKEGNIFTIPTPYAVADKPSEAEIRADLNNGVTPINWKPNGQAYIVRSITSRSLQGAIKDYRARSGHIPSCMDYYWETLFIRYFTTRQQFVADDPVKGTAPLEGVTYPRNVVALHNKLVDDLINFTGGPVLDPSYRDQMKASFTVVRLPDGLSARGRPIAVKPNNKGQFLLEEVSEAY